MNCQSAREFFPELLDPRCQASTESGVAEARAHLATCPECQRDFSSLSQTLSALHALPNPSPSPRVRRAFYAMLEEEKHSAASVRAATEREQSRRRASRWRWVVAPFAAAALVAAGFVSGRQTAPLPAAPGPVVADVETRRELHELRAKVDRLETMNQLVAASFDREQRPANERLHTVLTSAKQENPSDRLIQELITSLALDPSSNVRLRALEALYPHADQDLVRAGVLASLSREPSPLVQVAMIDFLAAARDRDARPTLEKITVSESADTNVRQAAKRALAQL